jgi:hypothetical protein
VAAAAALLPVRRTLVAPMLPDPMVRRSRQTQRARQHQAEGDRPQQIPHGRQRTSVSGSVRTTASFCTLSPNTCAPATKVASTFPSSRAPSKGVFFDLDRSVARSSMKGASASNSTRSAAPLPPGAPAAGPADARGSATGPEQLRQGQCAGMVQPHRGGKDRLQPHGPRRRLLERQALDSSSWGVWKLPITSISPSATACTVAPAGHPRTAAAASA